MGSTKADRVRAAGITILNDTLLVVYRRRDSREYYTFPGGMIEKDELPAEAVVREFKEETTIDVAVERLCYTLHRPGDAHQDAREYFFLCTYVTGKPTLAEDSIERKINDPEHNFFDPRWVSITDLKGSIPLFPTEVAAQLFHDLEHGFQSTPVSIKGITIGG